MSGIISMLGDAQEGINIQAYPELLDNALNDIPQGLSYSVDGKTKNYTQKQLQSIFNACENLTRF